MTGWIARFVFTYEDGNDQLQGENEGEKKNYVYDFINNRNHKI